MQLEIHVPNLTSWRAEQGKAIRLEEDDRFLVTHSCGKPLDPRLIVMARGSATRRVLRAVAAGNIVGNRPHLLIAQYQSICNVCPRKLLVLIVQALYTAGILVKSILKRQ